ncbi:hypothetical protein GR223_23665 [Rhizobium leguminosarum]|uniref:hypothetical protein n=1 Tax=Rhizobium ruizarguesonis TaxID=2081791 RepID=UPI0013DF48AF|nr:hypothetical protein [Rhizobium ruizarguesonis]NEJ88893.1 hypothetical protein [Rhizobium ruizarguesonis]
MKYKFRTFENRGVDEVGSLVTGDVAIVSASWETRSQVALSALKDTPLKKLIVIRFDNSGKTGVSGNIRGKYKEFCKQRGIQHIEIRFNSVAQDYASLAAISKEIDRVVGTSRRVILDITSTPRLLWCSLIALWDKKNSIRTIAFLYARPNYSFNENPNKELIFDYTHGDWQLCEPAFFTPNFRGGLSKTNFISIGYEYDQIKKLLYKFEADNNFFIYSNPGFQPSYTELAEKTIAKIRNVFEVPERKFMAFGVNDFVGLYQALRSKITETNDQTGSSVLIVCAGSKIHSLALLFCAFANPTASLRIRVPTRYNEVSTGWADGVEGVIAENVFCPI